MCFVKHGCLPTATNSKSMLNVKIWQNLKVPHFDPALTQRHVMSGKCEQPNDELTVLVSLLYDHQNFKYWIFYVSGTELRTNVWRNRRTDGWTDDPIHRCPGGPFRPLKTFGRTTVRREIWLLCNNRSRYRSVCSILCLSLISYTQCRCVHPT